MKLFASGLTGQWVRNICRHKTALQLQFDHYNFMQGAVPCSYSNRQNTLPGSLIIQLYEQCLTLQFNQTTVYRSSNFDLFTESVEYLPGRLILIFAAWSIQLYVECLTSNTLPWPNALPWIPYLGRMPYIVFRPIHRYLILAVSSNNCIQITYNCSLKLIKKEWSTLAICSIQLLGRMHNLENAPTDRIPSPRKWINTTVCRLPNLVRRTLWLSLFMRKTTLEVWSIQMCKENLSLGVW